MIDVDDEYGNTSYVTFQNESIVALYTVLVFAVDLVTTLVNRYSLNHSQQR